MPPLSSPLQEEGIFIILYMFIALCLSPVRDWSPITGRGGGATKRKGAACEVLPLRKGGGGGISFSHAEGGARHVLG